MWSLLRYAVFATLVFVAGCAPTREWIPQHGPHRSCVPDRLLTWNDFRPDRRTEADTQRSTDSVAAQIHVTYRLEVNPPRIVVHFDPQRSWVRSDIQDPTTVAMARLSQRVLAHERTHFMISCLLARQANLTRLTAEELPSMLRLVKALAQRLNTQYDQETRHGSNWRAQAVWDADVQEQFADVSSPTPDSTTAGAP